MAVRNQDLNLRLDAPDMQAFACAVVMGDADTSKMAEF